MFTFITGGYRTGRSSYALRRATELGPPPWCYASCGVEADEALQKRLQQHRRDQEAIWVTRTVPDSILDLTAAEFLSPYGALVIDGFAKWIENRVTGTSEGDDTKLMREIENLADRLYRTTTPVVLVSREVGFSSPPEAADARRAYRLTSGANQILAASAANVALMVSGIPVRVK